MIGPKSSTFLRKSEKLLINGTFGILPNSHGVKALGEKNLKTVLGEFDITSETKP